MSLPSETAARHEELLRFIQRSGGSTVAECAEACNRSARDLHGVMVRFVVRSILTRDDISRPHRYSLTSDGIMYLDAGCPVAYNRASKSVQRMLLDPCRVHVEAYIREHVRCTRADLRAHIVPLGFTAANVNTAVAKLVAHRRIDEDNAGVLRLPTRSDADVAIRTMFKPYIKHGHG